MRKTFLILSILVSSLIAFAQEVEKDTTKFGRLSFDDIKTLIKGRYTIEDNGTISIVRVIDNVNVPVDLMYNRARDYFTYNYGSGKAVMQFEDKENKSLTFQGIYANFHTNFNGLMVSVFDCWHIVKIDFKENKFRLILTLKKYTNNLKTKYGTKEIDLPINKMFPYQEKSIAVTKRQDAIMFYKVLLKLEKTMIELERAIKEGNTSKAEKKSDW